MNSPNEVKSKLTQGIMRFNTIKFSNFWLYNCNLDRVADSKLPFALQGISNNTLKVNYISREFFGCLNLLNPQLILITSAN